MKKQIIVETTLILMWVAMCSLLLQTVSELVYYIITATLILISYVTYFKNAT